jgi:glyceraldehyde 3-phosphate dehydrogenase
VPSYPTSQVLLDVEASDLRRSRAAALNIIPTTTGAATMLEKIMPQLQGKMSAIAVRVPVGKVSFIEVTVTTDKETTVDAVNQLFIQSSQGALRGFLDVCHDPLVSSDFSGNEYSVVVDSLLTQVHKNSVRVFGWYDNEWAYSVRLKDFLCMVS